MTIISLIGLFIALFIFAVSPGPGVFATVSRSMASGFRPAVMVVTGIILGDIIYLIFAIFGLTFVAHAMGEFFLFVRVCGGVYLVWLGLRIWRSKTGTHQLAQIGKKQSKTENVISGLFVSLSNPKVILFYCGFLPAFIDISALTLYDIFLVVGLVIIVLAIVLTAYAYFASKTREVFLNTRAMKRVNKIAGGLMIASGVAIASRS